MVTYIINILHKKVKNYELVRKKTFNLILNKHVYTGVQCVFYNSIYLYNTSTVYLDNL